MRNILNNQVSPLVFGLDGLLILALEVALTGAGADSALSSRLADGRFPSEYADLQDMLYIARSGAPAFRQLAARALGGSDSPGAESALRQLLYDSDSPVSDTAFYSIATRGLSDSFLHRLYESVPETRLGSPTSLRPQIMYTFSKEQTEAAREHLIRAMNEVDRPDSEVIRAVAADRLFRQFDDHSENAFAAAAESSNKEIRKLARKYVNQIREAPSEGAESTLHGRQ